MFKWRRRKVPQVTPSPRRCGKVVSTVSIAMLAIRGGVRPIRFRVNWWGKVKQLEIPPVGWLVGLVLGTGNFNPT